MSSNRSLPLAALIAVLACSAPTLAQSGNWGPRGWDRPGAIDRNGTGRSRTGPDSREGRVQVEQFRADDADGLLGRGGVAVTVLPGSTVGAGQQAIYEAAVIDQLVKAGYDTLGSASSDAQVTELRIVRDVVVPEETKRSPISGSMSVGVSNRGTMTAMGVNVDLTKPKKALVSTRLEARIRDRATDKVLWEGRATVVTREGDGSWSEQAISNRLAAALFEKISRRS